MFKKKDYRQEQQEQEEQEQRERDNDEAARFALRDHAHIDGAELTRRRTAGTLAGTFVVSNRQENGVTEYFGPFASEDEARDFIGDTARTHDDMDVMNAEKALSHLGS